MGDLHAACGPHVTLTSHGDSTYSIDGGFELHVVDRSDRLAPALRRLREGAAAYSRRTGTLWGFGPTPVAIDLEWQPDFRPGSNNPVALIQLAAADVAVLVRTCVLGFPAELRTFLSDPSLKLVGLNYDQCDARKMASSFGWDKSHFGDFEDLARAAQRRGVAYGGRPGLASLAATVLGVTVPKCKHITLSNWAAHSLSGDQIWYAALDAILCWHIYQRL